MISELLTFLATFGSPFVLGLLTPLTAVCVLPLYPGFLVYLAGKVSREEDAASRRRILLLFGLLITLGATLFMMVLGVVFTLILQISLTQVVGIVSPIAFGFLLVISILLMLDVDMSRFVPKAKTPVVKNPYLNALIFGFLFGGIVVPCNPGFIAALFATTPVASDIALNMIRFILFGLGLGAPMIAFSALSMVRSDAIIQTLIRYKTVINRGAGLFMFVVSLYYLVIVFNIFGL